MCADPSAVGIMDSGYFVSKRDLQDWLRSDFGLENVDIKECGNGLVYLSVLDRLHPGKVPLKRAKLSAKQEWEFLHNLKLLQSVFQDCHIRKHVEIDKLAKRGYQDNLEFLQWLKCYYDRLIGDHGSQGAKVAEAKQNLLHSSARSINPSAPAAPVASHSASRNSRRPVNLGNTRMKSNSSVQLTKTAEEVARLEEELETLKEELSFFQEENRFYYGKLRRLEMMSLQPGRATFTTQEVQDILFTEEDLPQDAIGSSEEQPHPVNPS